MIPLTTTEDREKILTDFETQIRESNASAQWNNIWSEFPIDSKYELATMYSLYGKSIRKIFSSTLNKSVVVITYKSGYLPWWSYSFWLENIIRVKASNSYGDSQRYYSRSDHREAIQKLRELIEVK